MASYDNTYSRVVAWLKIILPILALAILSTLFLVARTIDPAKNIPYAEVDIDELAREQRIGNPDFSGLTEGGAAIRLKAREAKPDAERDGRVLGREIDATIDLPDGQSYAVTAPSLSMDNADQVARLSGGVLVTSSEALTLRTEALEMGLRTTRVASPTETVVDTGNGTLTAGNFVMTGDGTDERPYLVVFKGGVHLIYDPEGVKGQ